VRQLRSADFVLCDRLVADPADPDKPADIKGTPDVAASDITTAIRFCKVASGSSRRALYQLGCAYAANRQMPEAIGAWRKAADKGSTSADRRIPPPPRPITSGLRCSAMKTPRRR
jgi:hypothetical protein